MQTQPQWQQLVQRARILLLEGWAMLREWSRRGGCWLALRLCKQGEWTPAPSLASASPSVAADSDCERMLKRMEALVDALEATPAVRAALQHQVEMPVTPFPEGLPPATTADALVDLPPEQPVEPDRTPHPVSNIADAPKVALQRLLENHQVWEQGAWEALWEGDPDPERIAGGLLQDYAPLAETNGPMGNALNKEIDAWLRGVSGDAVQLLIPAKGERFDRNRHEGVEFLHQDKLPLGTVLRLRRPGLKVDGQVRLRAQVDVVR